MKNEIRKQYKLRRNSMTEEEVNLKSTAASLNFLASDIYINSKNIMIYIPIGKEADTKLIMDNAFRCQKTLICPITDKVTYEIKPCIITVNSDYISGAFSIPEPTIKTSVDIDEIDLVLVPGIAFDKNGGRIGYGKGCYDKFLKNCTAIKVGFCYDNQICEDTFGDKYDVKMNYIITDKEIIVCK